MQTKPKLRVFLDSNVLFSGLYSADGPAGVILRCFVEGKLRVVISQQVLEEVVRTIKEKLPEALPALKKLMVNIPPEVVGDRPSEEVARWAEIIHIEDAGILASAVASQPDYLITGDKHFFRNSIIAEKSGLHIITPAQFIDHLKAVGLV